MKRTFTLLCSLLLFLQITEAQVNYTFTAGTRTYTALSGGTSPSFTSLGITGASAFDEGSANGIALPFAFTYNGTVYNSFNINTNGFIAFGAPLPLTIATGSNGSYFNNLTSGPSTNAAGISLADRRPLIAPLWDDMDFTSAANITYGTVGTAPNRAFVIQFNNALWDYAAAASVQAYQIRLVEGTNVIEFSYNALAGAVGTSSGGASIGITAAGTGSGNFISVNPATNTVSTAAETSTILTKIPSNTLYTFTPVPVSVPSNDSCGAPIIIGSNGTAQGTNVFATQSLPASSCDGAVTNQVRDVWFRFTPSSTGAAEIRVAPIAGSGIDPIIELYIGTATSGCAGLTQVTCRDTYIADTIRTNLTAGVNYMFRVYGYGTGTAAATSGAFTINITGVTLPVTLKEFTGERRNGFNTLSWTTATEQNNKGFEVERSYDGSNFGRIGFVASQDRNGNSSLPLTYSFNDEKAGSALVYYRLKQVDFDGLSSLSNVVTIKGEKATKVEITTVYPNPVKSLVNVTLRSPERGRVNFIVTDIAGRVVSTTLAQLVAGDNNLQVNMQGMRSGSYLLKAVDGEGNSIATKVLVKE